MYVRLSMLSFGHLHQQQTCTVELHAVYAPCPCIDQHDYLPQSGFFWQANYYSCGAYGVPIANTLGGPTPLGCVKGDYSADVQGLYENLAVNEIDHVAYIQAALGESAVCVELARHVLTICTHVLTIRNVQIETCSLAWFAVHCADLDVLECFSCSMPLQLLPHTLYHTNT